MRKSAVLAIALVTPVLMLASPNSSGAAEEAVESPFLLQDHGSVRILRGLNADQNFEAATLPKDLDVAPAAAPPEPQVEPRRTRVQPERMTTRQLALRRLRERGITVHRAGVRRAPWPEIQSTRRQAIERQRERGIPVNRAGG